MLTDEQIDYLLQIRETKPPLSEKTVRVMLGALRWSPEEIQHGINFLNRPPAPEDAQPPTPVDVSDGEPSAPTEKPIVIKQNPFPVGSPLLKNSKSEIVNNKKLLRFAGIIVGLIVFIEGLFVYAKLVGIGQ